VTDIDPAASSWDATTDVLVLGFGGAGCAAAIAAHDAGAEVLILEKMPESQQGGNLRVSGGVWFDTKDVKGSATYLRALCGGFPLDEDIIEVWAQETARNTEWIESLGIPTAMQSDPGPEYPELDGSDSYGGYIGVGGAFGREVLWKALVEQVRSRGIEVRVQTRALQLVQEHSGGPVHGVIAEHDGKQIRIHARRGVVLATGGFENNPEMVRDYLGIPGRPTVWGSQAGTGDGIKMAMKAGADLWHMDNMMSAVGIKVPDFASGFLFDPQHLGYVFVGLDGTRFTNELPHIGHGQALIAGSYELFPTKPSIFIFDEDTRLNGPVCPNLGQWPVGYNLLVEEYVWSEDNSIEIEKGWIHKADSIKELAGDVGVDPDTLQVTIDRYNAACNVGVDEQFGRAAETLIPLVKPPYYACEWGPMLGWTNGGPRRNHRAEVLDPFGDVIAGLYAAGNISSTYSWCKDGGFHIADALAFGRVAGREAAAAASVAR
jgi:succinate dehydrogenase/fumarate reductase flavoprotein subunit